MSDDHNQLLETARTWARRDPNPVTAAHVQRLVDQRDVAALQRIFSSTNARIAFGTAGLRGAMAPGPLRMNDLVVVQTAQGLARYWRAQQEQPQRRLSVVIGYDHREAAPWQISSRQFAVLTALVFRQAGGFDEVLLLDGHVATPLVPFTVLRQTPVDTTTCYGIMITASHNPRQDAGYKIYGSDGCQIRGPVDRDVAASIQANLEPWIDYGAKLRALEVQSPKDDPCRGLSDPRRTREITDAYFAALQSSGLVAGQAAQWKDDDIHSNKRRRRPAFCYTALHGVGHPFAQRAFQVFGLPPFQSVPAQQKPDAAFPTVPFPNPEEPGALALAQAHATETNCDIVLANDPDADRLAVAERVISGNEDAWTVFTGDQIGVMLGHWLWRQFQRQQQESTTTTDSIVPAMCASTVSSAMLGEICAREGIHFEDTLTGFKHIGSRAASLDGAVVPQQPQKKYQTIFCYEEASKSVFLLLLLLLLLCVYVCVGYESSFSLVSSCLTRLVLFKSDSAAGT